MTNSKIYWLHLLSPTHVGVGRGVGYIDLPIDRDKVTNWPIIRGSAFKGVWRDWAYRENRSDIELAFGRADKNGESANSGALLPTDAKIVCLPVRSFRGTFAWATSPLVLKTLKRTLELAGMETPIAPPLVDEEKCFVTPKTTLKHDNKIYLEDLDFLAEDNKETEKWANLIAKYIFADDWVEEFEKRFVIIPDNAFDFLCETGTEVHTRVKIDDDTKTVAEGALWTEESLPAETILMGLIQCDRVFGSNGEEKSSGNLLQQYTSKPLTLQLGGKATVGRGQVHCVFSEVN